MKFAYVKQACRRSSGVDPDDYDGERQFTGRVLCCFTSEWLAELFQNVFDGYLGADWKQRRDKVWLKLKAANFVM